MKAAVFRGVRDVALEEVAEPELSQEGIIVAVEACGICGTDLHSYTSGMLLAPGQIMGHEFAGPVVAVGNLVEGIAVGDRVTAMPLVPCGECRACARDEIELCAHAFAPGIGFGYAGAFTERVHIPKAQAGLTVFSLPEGVDYEAGALVEPLAVAVHAVEQLSVSGDGAVVVLGLGPIGQLVARVLQSKGVGRVVGVDVSELRLAVAERAGIETVRGAADVTEAVRKALGTDTEVDAAFECTGVPAFPQQATDLVRKGGEVVVVATYEEPAPVDVSPSAIRQVTIRGTTAYRTRDFVSALELLRSGAVDAAQIITSRAPLDELPSIFESLLEKNSSVKALIRP